MEAAHGDRTEQAMPIQRKVVATEQYRGSTIEARFMGPDLLAVVDGTELPNFFWDASAAKAAGRRFIDQMLKRLRVTRGASTG